MSGDRRTNRRRGRKTAGRRVTPPISPEAWGRAVHEVMTVPLIEPATLSVVLDIGLQAAYREAASGRFGAFKIGRVYKIPTPALREALGLSAAPVLAPASTDHAATAA